MTDNDILEAFKKGDRKKITAYMPILNNLELTDAHDGNTLLHFAINKKLTDVAKELIEKGANVNISNSVGETPLYLACRHGLGEIVKLLYLKKANIETQSNDQIYPTAIFVASAHGYKEIVYFLIEHKANYKLKNSRNETFDRVGQNPDARHSMKLAVIEKELELWEERFNSLTEENQQMKQRIQMLETQLSLVNHAKDSQDTSASDKFKQTFF